ncbi:MAG TPA: zf-HC2 domain-containing protein [bacterium]|nr:zf-HC2 domain-containing protein [bacterium]HOC26323.1 zf-HC2 domain-containing protein [bacterium]HOH08284.1 zf-HC2 domain-containing protein [bacterium]HOY45875.1 zf-HC2 domain-containing protein [bacterium]HPG84806.1 zf-HC2 domain-containing protein [bacterium]
MRRAMTCKEIEKRLSAHLDGELEMQSSHAVQEHIAGCPACRRAAARLQQVYALLPEVEIPAPDPFMATRVRAALAGKRRFRPVHRLLLPASVAAGLVLGMILGRDLYTRWSGSSTVTMENLEVRMLQKVPGSSLTASYLDLSNPEGNSYE